MTDRDYEENKSSRASEAVDLELDMALARYAAVEPRPGVEERILASMRAERARVPDRAWWRWTAVIAVAAAVIVAVALAWRAGKQERPVVAIHRTNTTQESQKQPVYNVPATGDRSLEPRPGRKRIQRAVPSVAAGVPKLDQFPSPQPLSEQEKLLASYVAEYPENAVRDARAQAEGLRRDQEEAMRYDGRAHDNDSQQQNK
jgi:hypothetical protein